MATRTHMTKSGDTYKWEETPEVLEALKQLHAGDYQGRLHAPHRDLANGKETN